MIAKKFTKTGELWLTVTRNPDGTAHIERTNAVRNVSALVWDAKITPEEWIANNGPNSQDRWEIAETP